MSNILPPGPLAYEGDVSVPYTNQTATSAPVAGGNPTTSNNQYPIPTIWINQTAGSAWMLVQKPSGVAKWILLGQSGGDFLDITTPDGHIVGPSTTGTINFLNGAGMNITGDVAGHSITFNSAGGGLQWNDVTGTAQILDAGNGYVSENAALTTFTLPTTAAFGDFYIITGVGNGGWTLAQNASQLVILGKVTSTVGAGGSISSTRPSDTLQILCVATNTSFKAIDWDGNLTIV